MNASSRHPTPESAAPARSTELPATESWPLATSAWLADRLRAGSCPPDPAFDELLPGVLPSKYNEQKFKKLTFGLTKDSPGVTAGYTTCGSLPMYIARMLGDKAITGTNGVRTAGVNKGAWLEAGDGARPKPGDLYALLNKDSTDRAGGGISHVGVIVDASTNEWKTADAGQGDGWAADYVTREYDPDAGTLSGEIVGTSGPRPARVLAGWIDVEMYPFP